MCGGRLSIARRSFISVSPVRTAVRISGMSRPRAPAILQDFAERLLQIFLNVVSQSLERRNVQDLRRIRKFAGDGLSDQPVNAGEKRGQCFSGTRGRGNQSSFSGEDVRPALFLRLGCDFKAPRTIPERRDEPNLTPANSWTHVEPIDDARLGEAESPWTKTIIHFRSWIGRWRSSVSGSVVSTMEPIRAE